MTDEFHDEAPYGALLADEYAPFIAMSLAGAPHACEIFQKKEDGTVKIVLHP